MTYDEIMALVKHMKTDTIEQIQEREKEVMRIIQEKHDEAMLKIQGVSQENNDLYRMHVQIGMKEILARTPKKKIYFGKVKTE